MTKAKTDHADFVFAVKEHADGTPWIMCEPRGSGLPGIGDGFLGLTLREGIGIREAEEIAEYLNNRVEGLSHTQFIK